jgi:hypothetical protein
MKKLLSIYLSLSLALAPVLAKAQTTKMEDLIDSKIELVSQELEKEGIKILKSSTKDEIGLRGALDSGDFIIDGSFEGMGILRVKGKPKLSENGDVILNIARLQNINDTNLENVTTAKININKSADENILSILNAMDSIDSVKKDSVKKDSDGIKKLLKSNILLGAVLSISGIFLYINIANEAPKLGRQSEMMVTTGSFMAMAMIVGGMVIMYKGEDLFKY